jgi:hypothetical protein
MHTTDDFAVFIHYQVPVVVSITSLVYEYLKERGNTYFIGTRTGCNELAEVVMRIVALQEEEIA